jgi:hypothetical protein
MKIARVEQRRRSPARVPTALPLTSMQPTCDQREGPSTVTAADRLVATIDVHGANYGRVLKTGDILPDRNAPSSYPTGPRHRPTRQQAVATVVSDRRGGLVGFSYG